VFGPDTRPDPDEQEVLWQLMDAHQGRRVIPKLLGYIGERELNRERWVGALTASPVPLLFINGLLDPVSGAHMVDRWRELLPQSPVRTLPGIGHYPQLEDPESVLAACQPFFSSISG